MTGATRSNTGLKTYYILVPSPKCTLYRHRACEEWAPCLESIRTHTVPRWCCKPVACYRRRAGHHTEEQLGLEWEHLFAPSQGSIRTHTAQKCCYRHPASPRYILYLRRMGLCQLLESARSRRYWWKDCMLTPVSRCTSDPGSRCHSYTFWCLDGKQHGGPPYISSRGMNGESDDQLCKCMSCSLRHREESSQRHRGKSDILEGLASRLSHKYNGSALGHRADGIQPRSGSSDMLRDLVDHRSRKCNDASLGYRADAFQLRSGWLGMLPGRRQQEKRETRLELYS